MSTDTNATGDIGSRPEEQRSSILEVDNVTKKFGGLSAVDGASFAVEEGSFTGLVGPNGAGKSTMFNCITGVHDIDEGRIILDGEEIQGLQPQEVVARGLGRTFQHPKIFRGMTVRENLAFAARNQSGESISGALFRPGRVRTEEAATRERVDEILEFLEFTEHAEEFASDLSGGQRKLLELGRVLMLDPEVILFDEPMAGVNPSLTDDLIERLHDLNEEGRTIFLIEHDMDVIMNNCERVVVMHNGQTLAAGPPKAIQQNDEVREAYLGGGDDV
ncbi:ABC transporter ATP-binding protein [Halobacteriales archaeon Cl-PHB]